MPRRGIREYIHTDSEYAKKVGDKNLPYVGLLTEITKLFKRKL